VVVYEGGQAVGSVLIHERSRGGVTITTAPIDLETTLEARAYSSMRASMTGEAATAAEVSLFIQANDGAAAVATASQAELDAIASAYVTASAAMTAAYQTSGDAFDASVRAELLAEAAAGFASHRNSGMSAWSANRMFAEAALDAFASAGADLEATVLATAAAASTFDARLDGSSSIRGNLGVQPTRFNLLARERLSAQFGSSGQGSVAVAIGDVLADARAGLSLDLGLIDLRAVVDGMVTAMADATADACVNLLAASASTAVQAEVRSRAQQAFDSARLEVRLQTATTAQAAASAMASYRAQVRAAVQAMITASGSSTADVEAMTSLFIAAGGGAYLR
jgi:hypothetical protein